MSKTSSLLLASIAAVALMAPPATSQGRNKVTLEEVATDVINLQSYVKQMQETADKKNAETKALLEQILTRFSTIDSSVHSLGGALGSIKTADEKSARDIESAKADLTAIRTSVESLRQLNLDESLTNMKSQLAGIKKQIDDIQNTPTSTGPTSRQLFNDAYLEVQQGFNDLAISDLRDFVNTYPRDSRTPSAQVLIGNAYFAKGDYPQAIIAYDEAIQKYPESDTKCTALYKKGLTLAQLKQTTEANKIYTSVAKDCASTVEGPLAAGQLKGATPARGARGQ